MTVYWVNSPTDSALDAMAAVEHALETGDTGTAPRPASPEPEPLDLSAGNSYLAENLELLHTSWAVDPNAIVLSSRPYFGWAINRFQGLLRRATWWFLLPQWLRVNEFHGATVRTIDSLLEQQRQLRVRVAALENPHTVDRVQALEEQLRGLRADIEALRRQLASQTEQRPLQALEERVQGLDTGLAALRQQLASQAEQRPLQALEERVQGLDTGLAALRQQLAEKAAPQPPAPRAKPTPAGSEAPAGEKPARPRGRKA